MNLLTDLLTLSEAKNKDLTALPEDLMKEIQKNIRKGAEDLEQKWANALELVHKAYDVAAVQRPTPDMEEAWKQYEENLAYAVEQLSKARGIDADWRMSSVMFHEALHPQRWKIKVDDRVFIKEGVINEIVDNVIREMCSEPGTDVQIGQTKTGGVVLRPSEWGILSNRRVYIERA